MAWTRHFDDERILVSTASSLEDEQKVLKRNKSLRPSEETYRVEQFVPQDLRVVFDFFSKAENLEFITPPWLNFQILTMSTPKIVEGTLLAYRLRIHRVPVLWTTRISVWKPPEMFQDLQLKGPYRKWEHTHWFKAVDGGTLMTDEVIYEVPGGRLGKMLLGRWVRNDIETIFRFRYRKIQELLA